MTDTQRQRYDSREFVTLEVAADVTLDTQPVAIAVVPYPAGDIPDESWHTVDWLGDPGLVRRVEITVGPGGDITGLNRGDYVVLLNVDDISERVRREVALLTLT